MSTGLIGKFTAVVFGAMAIMTVAAPGEASAKGYGYGHYGHYGHGYYHYGYGYHYGYHFGYYGCYYVKRPWGFAKVCPGYY
jgi:hypothetical protein